MARKRQHSTIQTSPSGPEDLLLTELEAAVHLGITPELLRWYTRYAAKADSSRRLIPSEIAPHIRFAKSELDKWDTFLSSPWSDLAKNRPDIPKGIRDYLRVESGGRCAWCYAGYPIDDAHIIDWEVSLSHHHHNVIRLCKPCHDNVHAGIIPLAQLKLKKEALVHRLRAELQMRVGVTRRSLVPKPTGRLIGREAELNATIHALDTSRVVTIEGPPGIGKTELLLHALENYSSRPVLWIELEMLSSVDSLADALARQFHDHAQLSQASDLFDLLSNHMVCVAIDGIEKGAPFEDALNDYLNMLIRRTLLPTFVLTSQTELYGFAVDRRIVVPPLDQESSIAVLKTDAQGAITADELKATTEVWQFCDGMPLALSLAQAQIRYLGSARPLAEYLARQGSAVLLRPGRQVHTRRTSVDICIEWTLATLDADSRRLLYYLSLHPGGCALPWIEAERVVNEPRRVLAELRRWHLTVDREARDGFVRIGTLSPIRSYVRERMRSEYGDRAEAEEIVIFLAAGQQATVIKEHYLSTGNTPMGVIRFDSEIANFQYAAREARQLWNSRSQEIRATAWSVTAMLSMALAEYYFVRGLVKVAKDNAIAGIEAYEMMGLEDRAAALYFHLFSATARDTLDGGAMRALITRATAWADRSKQPDIYLVADAICGAAQITLRRYDEGIAALTDAYERLPRIGSEVTTAEGGAASLVTGFIESTLTDALRRIGRLEDAARVGRQALARHREGNWDFGAACQVHEMANVDADQKRYSEALHGYLSSATAFARMNSMEYLCNSVLEMGVLACEWGGSLSEMKGKVDPDLAALALRMCGELLRKDVERLSALPDNRNLRVHQVGVRRVFGILVVATALAPEVDIESWSSETETYLDSLASRFFGNAAYIVVVSQLEPLLEPVEVICKIVSVMVHVSAIAKHPQGCDVDTLVTAVEQILEFVDQLQESAALSAVLSDVVLPGIRLEAWTRLWLRSRFADLAPTVEARFWRDDGLEES